MDSLQFAPGIWVPYTRDSPAIAVKGVTPRLSYPFGRFAELYEQIPSLDILSAYRLVREIVAKAAALLLPWQGAAIDLPPATSAVEARAMIAALFDARSPLASPAMPTGREPIVLSRLGFIDPRPWPFARGGAEKLRHTLGWIDTNVKNQVERACGALRADRLAPALAESALRIYALLIKMDDFALADRININASMWLQARAVELIVGPELYAASLGRGEGIVPAGALSNRIALELLRALPLDRRDAAQLCAASIFMGVIWSASEEVQSRFRGAPEPCLADLADRLRALGSSLAIDDSRAFLRIMGEDLPRELLVVLDDTGESVFDLALFQLLLESTGRLSVVFLANRYAVSNNMNVAMLEQLLAQPEFAGLRGFRDAGRVRIIEEPQSLNSFEVELLSPRSLAAMDSADLLYVKGQNFFEVFQPTSRDRFYAFVVEGMTSRLLTGCAHESGVFAYVPRGSAGYRFEGPGRITTLLDLHRGWE
jgi:hypothetical protein